MKHLLQIRYLTYALLIAIGCTIGGRHFIEVSFARHNDSEPKILPVDLSEWRGRGERWLALNFKDGRIFRDITLQVPYKGLNIAASILLQSESPGYAGDICRVFWRKMGPPLSARIYEVILYRRESEWIILDVGSWEESYEM